ncbi:MAG TPA: D-alanyl-D-alanine carboxypeptidase family protein [Acidocella sp.]|jgi:D-alanyl-D-alanine carboxypeptidase (penicillin-binding protein 5/6)|nr:D-alanyl-D-alanine carboxypeptidase family protein [Acidocella sp.]
MRLMIKPAGISSLVAIAAAVALGAPAVARPLPSNFSMTGKTPPPSGPAPVPVSPIADPNTPTPPVLPDMSSYVLMDARTGAIIAEANPNLQVAPASLTKLMTAHIVYQAVKNGSLTMNQTVPVSVNAWHTGGSRMFINPNTNVTVDELLHGLIIDSGNDAAVALAQAVAGTQDSFVQLMNRDAQELGLTNTHYTDVDGLPDPGLHTSALDVAMLSRAILQDEPQILNISKLPNYTYDNITQTSWNPVLAVDPTVDGLKTGLTNESGHCIDATAVRGDMRLIAVVMGGPSWHASTGAIEALLDYGQKFYTDTAISTAGQQIATLKSPALNSGMVPVGVAQTLDLTLPSDGVSKVAYKITYTADLTPGVTKGETLGTVTYTLDGKTLGTSAVVALTDSPPASLVTKLKLKLSRYL